MDIVAQIITEKVGEPKRKEFGVENLDEALSSSNERKHVTLYPANYKSVWQGEGAVEIPNEVTVTIMPGAVIEYVDDFYFEDFLVDDGNGGEETYSGPPLAPTDPNESSNHPLNFDEGDDPETFAGRYSSPKFTGAVENITDLNLGSEWAFRQEFEKSLWSIKGRETGEEEDNRNKIAIQVPFEGTVELDGGNKVFIENEQILGDDKGAKITVNHTRYEDNENESEENNPFKNTGTSTVIQTINVDDGHILDAEVLRVVERVGPNDNFLTFTGNRGKLLIGHAETGFSDENGNPAPAPTVPDSQSESDLVAGEDYAVSLTAFETDDRGHVNNIDYAPVVQAIEGGRGITVTDLEPGDVNVFEISTKISDYTSDGNVLISDGGSTIDLSLSNVRTRETQNSDPSDPNVGQAVTWLSDGTDSGNAGDLLIKVNIGGTVKQGKLFDYNAA